MHSPTAVKIALLGAAGLVGTGAATSSLAQTASPGSGVPLTSSEMTPAEHLINDHWVISAGTFILTSSLHGNLNGNANPTDQQIDFDRDFGTNSSVSVVRAGVLWRWTPRQHLRLEYFHNRVTGTRTLSKDIEWGNDTFLAGASVSAKNTFDVYELSYEYAFLRGRDYEIAGSAGIHFLNQKLQLSGEATVTNPDGTVQSASYQSNSSNLPAPLPVLGMRGAWAFAPRWYFDAAGQVFKVKIDSYDGTWWDLRTGVTWMYNRNFGVSAGYEKFTTHVNITKTNFNGSLNLSYQGMLLNVTAAF